MAVFPVPGGPAINNALPASFLDLTKSTNIPAASLAIYYPTMPDAFSNAVPSSYKPNPLIWLWCAIL